MRNFFILIFILILPNNGYTSDLQKAYFAGGCFWCMEESFDKINGVVKTVSGYSGGSLKNPTYKDVIYKDTGHVEAIEITYDAKKISYEDLLNIFWKNIDPFDSYGQFCDKGKSYRSVVFYQNINQKKIIKRSLKKIEKDFNSKVVTLVWDFEIFYKAEKYHQDFYQKNFLRYLSYKKACQREEVLNKIWN
jgi:peptide-methionine (S)-S-oxide reductase|tara:strand:+ start:3410 stop:3982 length:573 start_codon:yes stop_codon:yes gene_type:complete